MQRFYSNNSSSSDIDTVVNRDVIDSINTKITIDYPLILNEEPKKIGGIQNVFS